MGGSLEDPFDSEWLTGGSADVPKNTYEEQLAAMASELFSQTAPMRESLIGDMTSAAAGTYNPSKSPLFSPRFADVNKQYARARENIMSSTPRGGGLTAALTNLEGNRAGSVAEVNSGIINDMLSKAYGTAFSSQPMQGLSAAASGLSGRQSMAMQADAAQQAAKKQAQGQIIGGGAQAAGYAMGS